MDTPMPHSVIVRSLELRDADAVAILSAQLGYPCTAAEMRQKIQSMTDSSDRAVFVATLDGAVVGWADAALERHLQAPDTVVLGGLVVDENQRGLGIGKLLCQAVEQWAISLGIALVRVRSQIKREDAHRFYLREGYEQVKISAVFEKKLGS
jgi:GNAT superfamily N-acetyltransferase